MDDQALIQQMQERFRGEFAKAIKAVEDEPDSHWIDASEIVFRDAPLTVSRAGLELAIHSKTEAHPASRPSAGRCNDWKRDSLMTKCALTPKVCDPKGLPMTKCALTPKVCQRFVTPKVCPKVCKGF